MAGEHNHAASYRGKSVERIGSRLLFVGILTAKPRFYRIVASLFFDQLPSYYFLPNTTTTSRHSMDNTTHRRDTVFLSYLIRIVSHVLHSIIYSEWHESLPCLFVRKISGARSTVCSTTELANIICDCVRRSVAGLFVRVNWFFRCNLVRKYRVTRSGRFVETSILGKRKRNAFSLA